MARVPEEPEEESWYSPTAEAVGAGMFFGMSLMDFIWALGSPEATAKSLMTAVFVLMIACAVYAGLGWKRSMRLTPPNTNQDAQADDQDGSQINSVETDQS